MLKGNRTRIIGAAIAILGLVEAYAHEIVPVEWQPWTYVGIGIAMIILRQITTTPPGERDA